MSTVHTYERYLGVSDGESHRRKVYVILPTAGLLDLTMHRVAVCPMLLLELRTAKRRKHEAQLIFVALLHLALKKLKNILPFAGAG